MRIIIIKKKFIYIIGVLLTISVIGFTIYNRFETKTNIMGGKYIEISCEEKDLETLRQDNSIDLEKYFRPSNLPILNNKTYDLENLPKDLYESPENAIINYYSILREAANPTDKTNTGCGTIGYVKEPYPIAYKFLTSDYQNQLSYNNYLQSFENILHLNLIKLKEIKTDEEHPNSLKYFVEIEAIEGSKKPMGYFGYYYGFIYLDKVEGGYKINDMEYYGENYLCTPYHGWIHDAKSFVKIQYGDWCNLIKGEVKVETNGYVKNIYFDGTDGNKYRVEFFTLTNGDDIKISDFKKDNGKWIPINIDTKKYLEGNKKD